MNAKPRVSKSIYYWLTFEAARAYATSIGVELGDRTWPKAIRYELGWAIQLECSGAYLGPQYVKIAESAS